MAAVVTETTVQQRQQRVTSQLLLLLSQRLPVCDWNISSLHGHADGQANTTEAVRAWAAVIAGGLVTVTQDGTYLETHGVGGNERIRVWAKRSMTRPAAPSVEQAEVPLEEDSQRAALKVLTRAADIVVEQRVPVVEAIRAAATLYTPFGPQAQSLADEAITFFIAHLRYSEGNPVAYLDQWSKIRLRNEVAAELRAAGGEN